MRFAAHDGLRTLRRGLFVLGLSIGAAGSASAQLVFDGNLFFNNNNSGTLAGQFTGTAGAGAPGCAAGTTTALVGTTTYLSNLYADPLLGSAINVPNVVPSFQPGGGSPAYGSAVTVPNDGFFTQVCYRGAVGPNPGDDWTQGWTYYDSTGANRQDIHLVGMPDPRPLATYDNIKLYESQFWCPDTNYLIRGQLRVKAGAMLSVAPGVVIFQDASTVGTLIVERGAKLNAVGTKCDPIIITSASAPGSQRRGDCGGIAILGRARTNVVNSCGGDSAASEGGLVGFYGGNDDSDNSGCLRYVRVEYAGREITPNNELNSFTWNACGSGTKGDYLQSFRGADDGFEHFGGAMAQKYLLAVDGTDDGYDTQLGSRTRAQFVIVRIDPSQAPSLTQFGERGIEADNNEFNFDQAQCAGRSFVQVANATFVGDKRSGPSFPGSTQGVELRLGTGYTLLNSIVFNFKSFGLRVSDDATWQAHCLANPTPPTGFCGATTSVLPISEGNMFVASSQPNPFRSKVNFSFTLPQTGNVSVEIYSADGRRVDTVARGSMEAGVHSLAWTPSRDVPSGVYFYKVLAGNNKSSGKITHLD